VRGVAEGWSATVSDSIILARRQDAAHILTVRGDAAPIRLAIERAHPDARIEQIALSIHEACADRLRALETTP
jgi:hypothetical protein